MTKRRAELAIMDIQYLLRELDEENKRLNDLVNRYRIWTNYRCVEFEDEPAAPNPLEQQERQ